MINQNANESSLIAKICCLWMILNSLLVYVHSFGTIDRRARPSLPDVRHAARPLSSTTSRAEFMSDVVFKMSLGLTIALPTATHADITNKLASPVALRNVKSAVKKLSIIEFYVAQNDYTAIKETLRLPPFSEIRKSCTVLIRGGEDGPDSENLQLRYKDFTASLEKIDGLASLGMRGRNVASDDLYLSYKSLVESLTGFFEVAQAVAETPVQVSDS